MHRMIIIALSIFAFTIPAVKAEVLTSDMIKAEIQKGSSSEEIYEQYKNYDLSSEDSHKAKDQILSFNKKSQSCTKLSCRGKCMKDSNLTNCCNDKQCIGTCIDNMCIGNASSGAETASIICFFKCL